jgi:hypothetical protein
MKVKKEITFTFERKGDKLVFDSLRLVQLALGSVAVAGNLSIYGVEKKNGKYYVDIENIKGRRQKKIERIRKETEYLDIMDQILDGIGEKEKHHKNKKE